MENLPNELLLFGCNLSGLERKKKEGIVEDDLIVVF